MAGVEAKPKSTPNPNPTPHPTSNANATPTPSARPEPFDSGRSAASAQDRLREAESKGPTLPRSANRTPVVLALLALTTACGRDELAHGLEESQANAVLVALDEGGIRGEKRADERGEGVWRVDVAGADAARAQRILAERELPRLRAPGFGEVFGKGSVVPSPTEERALYLHALSGELARSVEAIDGVVEARVHLALAEQDPLRGGIPPASRAAVLVKARPGARGRVEPLAGGIAALVAGGVAGLDAGAVAVVVTEAAPIAGAPPRAAPRGRAAQLLAAAAAAAGAVALLARTTLARLGPPGLGRGWRGARR
ncbi:MAG: secretion protein [Anaeromyxobacteraceae bacterium]